KITGRKRRKSRGRENKGGRAAEHRVRTTCPRRCRLRFRDRTKTKTKGHAPAAPPRSVMTSRRPCRARRQRGHLFFKLVPRAKLVSYSVSLRLVFAHCGAWANDHYAPSMYGVWHHFHR